MCKLEKMIYYLTQSPRAWFKKFSHVVSEGGFQQCHSDHSMFIHHSSAGSVILAIYFDDILLTSGDVGGIEKAKAYLKTHFVTKDMERS